MLKATNVQGPVQMVKLYHVVQEPLILIPKIFYFQSYKNLISFKYTDYIISLHLHHFTLVSPHMHAVFNKQKHGRGQFTPPTANPTKLTCPCLHELMTVADEFASNSFLFRQLMSFTCGIVCLFLTQRLLDSS